MPKINEGSQSTNRDRLRHDFTRDEVRRIYEQPLTRLVARAAASHARYFNEDEIQLSTLLSIKTGGCREDCSYCSQSAHHKSLILLLADSHISFSYLGGMEVM